MSDRQPDWLLISTALDRILQTIVPVGFEEVDLTAAFGRTLVRPVASPIDQPPWANSAMDGYAVRAADIAGATETGPRVLDLLESVPAGAFPTLAVGPGQAIGVMTGAPIPEGADGVVRIEHTRRLGGNRIEVLDDADAGRNVRPKGEDLTLGEEVLPAGTVLRAGEIGVLATVGCARPPVSRRPRVGILSTGDELADLHDFESVLAGRRIINSNSYSLAAATLATGAEPVLLGIARDNQASLAEHLSAVRELDALVTTAGASVGEHDVVKDALERIGMQTEFWRVRIRPGSPFSYGLIPRDGKAPLPVFGLPGNPVSAVVTFEILVKPALRRMLGRSDVHARTIHVTAAERIASSAGLVRFLRVRLERRGEAHFARLTGEQGSGILTSVARADALLVVPLEVEVVEEGETVVALPLTSPDEAQGEIGF